MLHVVFVVVRMAEACESHDHQLDEEEDEDRHEADALHPRVLCDGPGKAVIGKSLTCGCQQLHVVRSDQSGRVELRARTCMKAVATMTPEPKYLAMKKAHDGTPTPWCLAAKTGNHVPRKDPTRMTKMAEMRTPMRPSKSLSVGQSAMAASLKQAAVRPGATS